MDSSRRLRGQCAFAYVRYFGFHAFGDSGDSGDSGDFGDFGDADGCACGVAEKAAPQQPLAALVRLRCTPCRRDWLVLVIATESF